MLRDANPLSQVRIHKTAKRHVTCSCLFSRNLHFKSLLLVGHLFCSLLKRPSNVRWSGRQRFTSPAASCTFFYLAR